MKPITKLILGVTALIAAAFILAWEVRRDRADGGSAQSAANAGKPSGRVANTTKVLEESASHAAAREPAISEPEFRSWLREQARELDRPSVDATAKKREIDDILRRLSPEQSRHLLETARSLRASAGEKILSTYLLVEAGALAYDQLRDLIASPFAGGPHPAHSEQELLANREKSLRIMAIDGLFARAQNDPGARQALERAIADIRDPYVRAYAEERLRRLNTQ